MSHVFKNSLAFDRLSLADQMKRLRKWSSELNEPNMAQIKPLSDKLTGPVVSSCLSDDEDHDFKEEKYWNSDFTVRIKKKKSDAKSEDSPTIFQTKPPSAKQIASASAVPSCLSDHEPKDMTGTDKFVQFGDEEEDTFDDDSLSSLVSLQQVTIAKLQKELLNMSNCMEEKDKTISHLQSKLGDLSQNHEIQPNQLMWLNSVVDDHEDIRKRQDKVIRGLRESVDVDETHIFNREVEIVALKSTLSDKSAFCEEQAITIDSMHAKFIAMYNHCSKLARDREKLEDYISAMNTSEAKTKEIFAQQQMLTKSLLALLDKEKKTKFINGSHSLNYSLTEPTPEVRTEMADSRSRIKREDIIRLVCLVENLAHKYSPDKNRYSQSNPTNDNEQVCVTNPDLLPPAVPKEMFAIWLFSHEEDLTEEEEEQYNGFLTRQMRPPPIYSPNLPKPYVNWMRLNTNMHRNLPKPSRFSVKGCAQDPAVYEATYICCGDVVHRFDGGVEPFGTIHGFLTDMGVVPIPDLPLHGYKYSVEREEWVIAASGG